MSGVFETILAGLQKEEMWWLLGYRSAHMSMAEGSQSTLQGLPVFWGCSPDEDPATFYRLLTLHEAASNWRREEV